MKEYADPEEWERDCAQLDKELAGRELQVLVIFDALDAIAIEWDRLRLLLDALLEVAWSSRGYRSLRPKLFLRPDQLRDLGLRFVELPKLVAGAAQLRWTPVDLYGMLFARLGSTAESNVRGEYEKLLLSEGVAPTPRELKKLRSWPLAYDPHAQARVFMRLAGAYMGRGPKKGRTYDWPPNHLADGHGEVTPRSFLTLAIEAARHAPAPVNQVISAEGIRHGPREASKVRVNQLELEFPWIKRVLAPLARLRVPCTIEAITSRWRETETVDAIMSRAKKQEFLPPFDPNTEGNQDERLIRTLARIGIIVVRSDNRFDMPDLFRVAARLLKKGGVAPT
jgi:hypothetical protein